MPLFLNEVWLGSLEPKVLKEAVEFFGNLSKGSKPSNLPDNMRMVAGPWLSNEEAKVLFVFEIGDPSDMLEAFAERMVSGLFARRKLTLLSDWAGARKLAEWLDAK
jgi:hypothetical protein